MKKSRIMFAALLASLGLAGAVSGQSNHFFGKQFSIGIVAKADGIGIPSPITNVNGDSTLLVTPYDNVNGNPLLQRAIFVSADGANSVYARPTVNTPAGGAAVTSVYKGIKNLTLNIPIINKNNKNIYFREFFRLPNDPNNGNPIFKIGTGDDGNDSYVLDPKDLGLTSDKWIPETVVSSDGQPTDNGLRYSGPDNGQYNFQVTKNSVASQREVSGIGFYGTIKANQNIDIKIPIYLSNPDTVTNGATGYFF